MFGKNCEPFGCAFRQSNQKTSPEGHFLLANFSQKFDGFADAPLSLRIQKLWDNSLRPEGQFLLDFL